MTTTTESEVKEPCEHYAAGELDCRSATRELGEYEMDEWCEPCKARLRESGVRFCRVCGCTEDDACADGCSWVPSSVGGSLCSSCGRL